MFVLCFQILGEAERLNWNDFDVERYLPPASTIVQRYVFIRSHCNGRKMEAGDSWSMLDFISIAVFSKKLYDTPRPLCGDMTLFMQYGFNPIAWFLLDTLVLLDFSLLVR